MTVNPSEDREKQFKEMGFLTFAWILGLNHVGMSNWDGMGCEKIVQADKGYSGYAIHVSSRR
jgi:hypothetical protein